MKRETIIKRIKGYLERRNAETMDFSEPYIFNCPPMLDGWYYLSKISLIDGALEFKGHNINGIKYFYDSKLSTEDLKSVVDFLCENRKYIDKYATIY